jgi:hypothetical protein
MGNKIDIKALQKKASGSSFKNSNNDDGMIRFIGTANSKIEENEGAGRVGLRGLGLCGNPHNKWPITHIHEETDEYIICCCDAGCGTVLLKNPPIKKKKGSKRKVELVKTLDGNLIPKKAKGFEDNIME